MDRRQLRKAMSPAGWIMVIYFLLCLVCVIVTSMVETIVAMMTALSAGGLDALNNMDEALMDAASGAWGYFLAAGIGLIILLLWKKPVFWHRQIWAKGKPMKPGAFFGILFLFLSAQCVYQFMVIGLEMLLNGFGLTMIHGLEAMSAGSDQFSMFLYVGILAPVTEELLCRGLVQRTLMPYGKRLAILGSAFLFGMFHGNILQAPYAFLVGLVLGYVASEYSIAWAMLLHMINNLVLGDMFIRLTANMNEMAATLLFWGILLACGIGAVVTVVCRQNQISAWMRCNPRVKPYTWCFFSSAGVITMTVLMILSMIATCFTLFTPL